jgi:hypothetical protein
LAAYRKDRDSAWNHSSCGFHACFWTTFNQI